LAHYEPSTEKKRKLKKGPLKDAHGKTLKVIYVRGRDNRVEAEILFRSKSSFSEKLESPITMKDSLSMFEGYLYDKAKKTLTVKAYLHDIKTLMRGLPDDLRGHSLGLVNSVIGALSVAPITKQKYAKSLSRYYDVMMQKGVIQENPMKGFEWRNFEPTPEPYTEEEIFKLLHVAKDLELKSGETYYVFLVLAFQVGLRLNEYINLRWDNLNWEAGVYNIFKDKNFDPKHSRKRQVRIPRQSLLLLKTLTRRGEFIFCKPNGKKWDSHFTRDFVNNIFKVAGIQGDLDRLRETFVSWSFACGRTHKSLKEHLGHRRYEELEAYDGLVNNPSQRIKELFGTIDVVTK